MAKNKQPEKPVVSDTESGEEEDDDASTEETGSDSEPEQTEITKKPSSSTPAASTKKTQPLMGEPSSSSDEEESGSESESDSDGPDPKVRPLASKPMDDSQKSNNVARNPRSKPTESDLVTPTKPAAGKRPAEEKETEAKDAKKSRKKLTPETSEKKPTDDSKKNLFQRLWSEDDEIVILKGMIDYVAKKKSDPIADLNAFHDFIRKSLQVDVTKTQLQDKIRRLKKKYENNKSKEKEGKERIFSKPHEQKAYELSKDIWGLETGKENGGKKVMGSPKANGSVVRKPAASKSANVAGDDDSKDVKRMVVVEGNGETSLSATKVRYDGASVEEWIMMKGVEMFEGEKGVEGEKEWKKLRMDEVDSYVKLVETKAAQLRFVFDKLNSAGYRG